MSNRFPQPLFPPPHHCTAHERDVTRIEAQDSASDRALVPPAMSPPSSIEESGNLALDKETTEHPEPPGKKDPVHHHGRLGIQHRRDTPDPANDGVTSQPKSTRLKDFKARLVDAAKFLPLGAAVIAPLATLLDIPALTQPWFVLFLQVGFYESNLTLGVFLPGSR